MGLVLTVHGVHYNDLRQSLVRETTEHVKNRVGVQLECVVGACVAEGLESLGLEVCWARGTGVSPVHAEEVEVVVVLEGRERWYWVKSRFHKVSHTSVLEEAVHLVTWDTQSMPVECWIAEEALEHDLVEEDGPKTRLPDLFLFCHSGSVGNALGVLAHSGDCEGYLGKAKCPTGVAAEVEVARELVGMSHPVGIGVSREEGREFRGEQLLEVGVATFTEDLPEVGVVQRLNRSELELENVALAGVHVNGVDTSTFSGKGIVEDIVTCRCDSQNMVILVQSKAPDVDIRVFPCPAIDVGAELLVDLLFKVRDTPSLTKLVVEGRKRSTSFEKSLGVSIGVEVCVCAFESSWANGKVGNHAHLQLWSIRWG